MIEFYRALFLVKRGSRDDFLSFCHFVILSFCHFFDESEKDEQNLSHGHSSMPVALPLMVSSMPSDLIWMSSRLSRSPTACLKTFLLTPNMA